MVDISLIATLLVMMLVGVGLVYLYGYVARWRWGADWTDLGTMMARRVRLDLSWPIRDHLLHAFLYLLKWVGFVLISVAVAIIVVALFKPWLLG